MVIPVMRPSVLVTRTCTQPYRVLNGSPSFVTTDGVVVVPGSVVVPVVLEEPLELPELLLDELLDEDEDELDEDLVGFLVLVLEVELFVEDDAVDEVCSGCETGAVDGCGFAVGCEVPWPATSTLPGSSAG